MTTNTAPLVIRKRWITRIAPKAVAVGVAANSLRLAEKIPSPVVWIPLIALNAAFIFLMLPKYSRKARQKLIIDDFGVTLTTAESSARCAWQDVVAIVKRDIDYSDRDLSLGITIRCREGQDLDLSSAWAMRQQELVQTLANRCEAVTGTRPSILGFGQAKR